MENPSLASLSLTHVHYDPNSHIAHICAYLALVPQALCITYATLIFSTRELEIALMFAGQMGCEALNWILKRYIREERPTQMLGKGYGMPSSHAQFVTFWAIYLTLFLLLRYEPEKEAPASTNTPIPLWQRVGTSIGALLGAAAVAQSRIHLNYHSPRQVYAGCLAGALCAIAWFIAVSIARSTGFTDYLLDTPLIRWVRLRDLLVHEDFVHAGWERWEGRRQKRALTSGTKKSR